MGFDKLLARAEKLSQCDDFWRGKAESLEAVAVGSERIGQNEGISAVVLGAGGSVTVSESVDLLWIDGEDGDTTFEKGLDHGTVWFFYSHGDVLGPVMSKLQ